jgi:hypothetical protein
MLNLACCLWTERELTWGDCGCHSAWFCASRGPPADPSCLQLTLKADTEADTNEMVHTPE